MWRKLLLGIFAVTLLTGFVFGNQNDVISEDQTPQVIQKNRADMAHAASLLAQDASVRNDHPRSIASDYTYNIPDINLPDGTDSSKVVTVSDNDVVATVTVEYDYTTNYASEGSFSVTSPGGTTLTIGAGQATGHYLIELSGFMGESLSGDWTFTLHDSYGDGGQTVSNATFGVDASPNNSQVSLSTDSLGFGEVPVGLSSGMVFTINNTGQVNLNISNISSINSDFSVDVTSGTVSAFGSQDVTVTFAPTMAMDYNTFVIITSDAPSSPDTVNVTGTGLSVLTSGGPDASGYLWTSSLDANGPTYNWIDTTGATDAGIAFGDDIRGTIDLPFPITFYGNEYSQITGTTNGWIGMGPSTNYSSSYWTNSAIPNASSPNNIIAPLWDDFKAGDSPGSTSSYPGTILYKTVGTSPHRQFVVIFSNVVRSYGDTDGFTFEVIFNEGSKDFTFQYKDVTGNTTADNGVGGTIGIENGDGTVGLQYMYNGDPQLIYAGVAIQFTVQSIPPFFSDYMEGSSNNKALEIYNPSLDTMNLDNYQIAQSVNGGGWQYYHQFPAGAKLAPGDAWIITTDAAFADLQAIADEVLAYPSVVHFNGDDARALIRISGTDTTFCDVFGVPTEDPGTGWDVAGVTNATVNHTLLRKASVTQGDTSWATSAGTDAENSEWIVFPQDTYKYFGMYPVTDFNEPNDSLAVATPIASGDTLDATIDPESDLDFYTFTLATQSSVTINMLIDGYSSLDGEVALFSADSTMIASQDGSSSGGDEQLAFNALDAGTYYILAGYYSDVQNRMPTATTGAYAMNLETGPAIVDNYEPNNNLATATDVTPNDTLTALIDPSTDLDFFKLTLSGPGMLTVDMFIDGYSSLDGELGLYSADSTMITHADVGYSGGNEQIVQELSAGTYYVAAGYWSSIEQRSPEDNTGQYAIGFHFDQYTTGAVEGTVTDLNTSSPIEGAIVMVGMTADTTDAAGSYMLENIQSGLQQVVYMAPGYQTAMHNVEVVVSDTVTQDATLFPVQTDVVYTNGFEAGDDPGWIYNGGTHQWMRSGGFTFGSTTVAPAVGDSFLVVGGADGYDNNEFSWWMNLTDTNMDLTSYNSAKVHFKLWLDSESGYDKLSVLANQPAVDGGTYYLLDSNGDGVADDNDRMSGSTGGWVDVTVDLSPFTGPDYGDGVEIAFLFASDGSVTPGFGAAIDSVVVTGSIMSPILPPQNLTATSFEDGQVPLTWEAPLSGQQRFHTMTRKMDDESEVNLGKGRVSHHGIAKTFSREWIIGNNQVTARRVLETYNVFRVNMDEDPFAENPHIIANVSGTSYTDQDVTNFTRYAYAVSAVYAEGESDVSNIEYATPGVPTAATLPTQQDFEGVTIPDLPMDWGQVIMGQNGWASGDSASASSSAFTVPGHGQFAYVNDDVVDPSVNSSSILWSPWMDASGASNVMLSFNTFAKGGFSSENHYVVIRSGLTNDYTVIDSVGPTDNWEMRSYDLSSMVGGESYFQVGFLYGDPGIWGWGWAIDDFSVQQFTPGTVAGTVTSASNGVAIANADVMLEGTSYSTMTGSDGTYSIDAPPGDYSVTVMADEMESMTQPVTIVGGETATLDFALTPDVLGIQTVAAQDAQGGIQLSWAFQTPVSHFSDDFESYSPFSLMFDPWTLIDVDGSTTYGISNVDFPNAGSPMAYMIFNPDSTDPAIDSPAHSGSQYAASFAATTPPNNDFMVTPLIAASSTTQMSFFAKSYTDQYGLERFKVAVSTTGTDPADFTVISSGDYVEAPTDWTQYTYDLSSYAGQNIYVAIQCVSNDAFIFLVDDVTVGPSTNKTNIAYNPETHTSSASPEKAVVTHPNTVSVTPHPSSTALQGFNIYRGTDASSMSLHMTMGSDMYSVLDTTDMVAGTTYYYAIAAVYNVGEAPMSDTVSATYTAVNVEDGLGVPQVFALDQNYPNPFNPTTTIQYQLPKAATVHIAIYNMLGQQVRTLVNKDQTAGYYKAIWDGKNDAGLQVSTGMYFYRIKAGEFTKTHKMLMLK